jgi:hypothetical protein
LEVPLVRIVEVSAQASPPDDAEIEAEAEVFYELTGLASS